MGLLIKNGIVVSGQGQKLADVRTRGMEIWKVGPNLPQGGEEVIDARCCYVLPGLIDAHTHFALVSRGGARTADDFLWGSTSAIYGGVTTVIDFADCLPAKNVSQAITARIGDALGKAYTDFALHLVINESFDLKLLDEESARDVAALKVFTTYREAGYFLPEGKLKELFLRAAQLDLMVTVHAEDDATIARFRDRYPPDPSMHGKIRPGIAEEKAVQRILELGALSGCKLYFVHLTTHSACRAVAEARQRGQPVWAETCPHYLILTEKMYEKPDAKRYIMTPPLRTEKDQEQLWKALKDGTVQVIATDHCAYSKEQKDSGVSCLDTLPGIPGVETLLPLLFTYGVLAGRLSLEQLVTLLAENPAQLFGLDGRKGKIAQGFDADLVIWDPRGERRLSSESLHSRAGYTPYEGFEVKGSVKAVIRRGEVMLKDGEFMGTKTGRSVAVNKV